MQRESVGPRYRFPRLVFVIKLNATERAWIETTHHIPCRSHPQLANICLPKTPIGTVTSLQCSVELIDGTSGDRVDRRAPQLLPVSNLDNPSQFTR